MEAENSSAARFEGEYREFDKMLPDVPLQHSKNSTEHYEVTQIRPWGEGNGSFRQDSEFCWFGCDDCWENNELAKKIGDLPDDLPDALEIGATAKTCQ